MLIFLVVVRELGHFFTAKWFGVKVLEFGIGYPPKALGFYMGRTEVLADENTEFVNIAGLEDLKPGMIIKISSLEDENGNLVSRIVEAPQKPSNLNRKKSFQESRRICSISRGK